MTTPPTPTRELQEQPNLKQLKTQAKELLRAYRDGHADAIAEVNQHFEDTPASEIKLSHVQLVFARAHGFASWPKFILEVERRQPEVKSFRDDVFYGRSEEVKRLLESNEFVRNGINKFWFDFDQAAIHTASYWGHKDVVSILLDYGADPNLKSDWEHGPCSPIQASRDPEIAELIRQRGATPGACDAAKLGDLVLLKSIIEKDVSLIEELGVDQQRPLHMARTVEIASYLVEQGAELEARCDDHYSTPFMYHAAENPEVARYLLSQGAKPDIFGVLGVNDMSLLKQLLEEDPSRANARLDTGELATPNDECLIYTWTMGTGYHGDGNEKQPVIHSAAILENLEAIEILVAAGADVNAIGGYDNCTALHAAAFQDKVRAIQKLVELGAEIDKNSGKMHQTSPLCWACVAGRPECVKILIELGVRIEDYFLSIAKDGKEGRPIVPIAGTPEEFAEVEKILMQA